MLQPQPQLAVLVVVCAHPTTASQSLIKMIHPLAVHSTIRRRTRQQP